MKSRHTYLLDEVATDRPRLNDRGSDAPGRCGSFCAVAAHAAGLGHMTVDILGKVTFRIRVNPPIKRVDRLRRIRLT